MDIRRHHDRVLGALAAVAWLAFTPAPCLSDEAPPPRFESGPRLESSQGSFLVRWSLPELPGEASGKLLFEVERSEAPGQADPRMLYRGGDDRLFLSGLRDGTYRLRVRARSDGAWTGWSEPLELSVRHHPLSRAVVFLGLGAVVFGLTAATIVAGDRKVRAASGADAGEGAR